MPHPRLPHLQLHRTRHNKIVWYVRLGKGPRTRLWADYGTPEFEQQYAMALQGRKPAKKGGIKDGSFAWLVAQYRLTSEWTELSAATRKQRDAIFKQVIESAGDKPISAFTPAAIAAARDRRKATPNQSRHLIDTLRGLFKWAKAYKYVEENPAAIVPYLKAKPTQGFAPWTEEDIARYERRWPLGTKERIWLAVLLYTGLRRGDAVRLGPGHVIDNVATLFTEKSQGRVRVDLPILPDLAEALAAGPVGKTTFICGERGNPLVKESFGNLFADACKAAGVDKSAHGLRKAGASRAALNGATVSELEAIFGWTGGKMALHYTKGADRARLARGAITKMSGGANRPTP